MSDLGDEAKDFADSDEGEQATDAGLGTAADAADKATGGGHGDQIDEAEQAADDEIGQERSPDYEREAGGPRAPPPPVRRLGGFRDQTRKKSW